MITPTIVAPSFLLCDEPYPKRNRPTPTLGLGYRLAASGAGGALWNVRQLPVSAGARIAQPASLRSDVLCDEVCHFDRVGRLCDVVRESRCLRLVTVG